MKDLLILQRENKLAGGLECSTNSYRKKLNEIFNVSLLIGTKSPAPCYEGHFFVRTKGLSRFARLKSYVNQAECFIDSYSGASFSNEAVPGVTVIRLGGGLHARWLDIIGNNFLRRLDRYHRFKLYLEDKALKHPSMRKVIVNSNMVGNELVAKKLLSENKIEVIRNIVTARYEAHVPDVMVRKKNQLLFVGSGWVRKGLDSAIRSLMYLPDDWGLTVIGKDKNQDHYFKLVGGLKLSKRVSFLGHIDVNPSHYASHSVLLHPAKYEPFPNVAMESLSQGTPVVSSFNSGTSDFKREDGVWTLNPLDFECIANAILEASSITDSERMDIRNKALVFNEDYLSSRIKDVFSSI